MPTYNGATITTGILYEDGTIEILTGFGQQKFITKGTSALGITELKQTTKMLTPEANTFTNLGTTTVSISDLKQRTAIVVMLAKDTSVGTTSLSIVEIKQKTVIINT